MKTFSITQAQLEEIAGRANALTVTGAQNCEHIVTIISLVRIVAQNQEIEVPTADRDNVATLGERKAG